MENLAAGMNGFTKHFSYSDLYFENALE